VKRIGQTQFSPDLPDDSRLKMVKRVTKLMDEQFAIGKFRFGLDPILNFIPLAGDLGGFTVSVALILTMIQYGVSGRVAAKMLGNAAADALIGAIPVLGWIFDFTYKANTRNVKLLSEHYTQGKHQGSATPVIISFIITAFFIMIALIIVSVIAFSWIISFFWQGN
jgi:hypothetical protein